MNVKGTLEALRIGIIFWLPLFFINFVIDVIFVNQHSLAALLTFIILVIFVPLILMQLIVLKSILEEIEHLNDMVEKSIKDNNILRDNKK